MQSEWAISIRRACAVILFNPKAYRYKSRRPDQAALEQRIKEICQTRVRFGYLQQRPFIPPNEDKNPRGRVRRSSASRKTPWPAPLASTA
jgi:hypothetical protein